jgi:hypothetical protein
MSPIRTVAPASRVRRPAGMDTVLNWFAWSDFDGSEKKATRFDFVT